MEGSSEAHFYLVLSLWDCMMLLASLQFVASGVNSIYSIVCSPAEFACFSVIYFWRTSCPPLELYFSCS